MGETIIHETVFDIEHGPVQAVARWVNTILDNDGNERNLLSNYMSTEVICSTITSTQIRTSVMDAVRRLDLEKIVILCELVGIHSLWAGGEMAMKLQVIVDTTIWKQVHWSGATFLVYIHNQIDHLTKGLLTAMSSCMTFTNIAVIEDN